MSRTKFIALLDGQVIGARTTASRDYTHFIVGTPNIEAARRHAYDYKGTKTDASNYRFHLAFLDGTSEFLRQVDWRTAEEQAEHNARYIESSRKELAGIENLEQYVASVRQRYIASFEERVAAGHFNPGVLQWSMSEANARKAAGGWSQRYLDVRVLPATKA